MLNIDLSLSAIQTYKAEKGIYLRVVGKGENQHLEAVKQNWFGRLLMWLGCSSASMAKVIKFLDLNMHALCSAGRLDLQKDGNALEKLTKRTVAYSQHHRGKLSDSVKNITAVYAQYNTLQNPVVEPLQPVATLPVKSEPALSTAVVVNNPSPPPAPLPSPKKITQPPVNLPVSPVQITQPSVNPVGLAPVIVPLPQPVPASPNKWQQKKEEILADNPTWVPIVNTWQSIELEDQVWLLRVFELRKLNICIPFIEKESNNQEIVGIALAKTILQRRKIVDGVLEKIRDISYDSGHNYRKIPDAICLLVNLTWIQLKGGVLTACPDLSQNKKLETLILSDNRIAEAPNLDANVKLKRFEMRNNHLKAAPCFDKNVELVELDLTNNEIASVPDFSQNKKLKQVSLKKNKISGVVDFSHNAQVNTIDLSENPLSAEPNLKDTLKLIELRLSSCNLTSLPDLSGHSNLRSLAVNDNPLPIVGELSKECFRISFDLAVDFDALTGGEMVRLIELKKKVPRFRIVRQL